jgi:metal-dependent amidase/aminoacylase/carboxypeptidase family protein
MLHAMNDQSAPPSSLLARMRELAPEMRAVRQDIHRHPELAYEEKRTAAIVAERLRAWGIAVHEGIGGTGVVGVLEAGKSSRRIGLRADMDALPIQEASGLPYESVHRGCASRSRAASTDASTSSSSLPKRARRGHGR